MQKQGAIQVALRHKQLVIEKAIGIAQIAHTGMQNGNGFLLNLHGATQLPVALGREMKVAQHQLQTHGQGFGGMLHTCWGRRIADIRIFWQRLCASGEQACVD